LTRYEIIIGKLHIHKKMKIRITTFKTLMILCYQADSN